LVDKMFGRSALPLRSSERENADREYFRSLFSEPWTELVIKRDKKSGEFKWFTQRFDKPSLEPAR
jgi:hypothetical protein